jgi:hypothetical protein
MPDDTYFVFCANLKDEHTGQIGVNTTTHKDVLDTVTDNAIRGLLYINEKLAGWALKLIPLLF